MRLLSKAAYLLTFSNWNIEKLKRRLVLKNGARVSHKHFQSKLSCSLLRKKNRNRFRSLYPTEEVAMEISILPMLWKIFKMCYLTLKRLRTKITKYSSSNSKVLRHWISKEYSALSLIRTDIKIKVASINKKKLMFMQPHSFIMMEQYQVLNIISLEHSILKAKLMGMQEKKLTSYILLTTLKLVEFMEGIHRWCWER